MSAFKTKTGDESLLVLKNKDKEEGRLTILTTDPAVDLNYHNSTFEDASRLSISILNSTPVPSFTELARASPLKGANLVQF